MVFFTLVIGVTGIICLTTIGNSTVSIFIMLALMALALLVSIMLALSLSRSIADPLLWPGAAAKKTESASNSSIIENVKPGLVPVNGTAKTDTLPKQHQEETHHLVNSSLEETPSLQDVDYLFSSLLNDVINIIRMKIIGTKLQFVVNIDSNIPNMLYGDEAKICQVLLTILNNAVTNTEKGFVSLTVRGEVKYNTVNLTIDITDSGKDINKEDIAQARSIVRETGGDITVISEFGKGSTISIAMPQKIREPKKLASVNDPAEKRVLVYELNEIYAKSIAATLGNLGIGYTLAVNDEEFCEKIADASHSFMFIAYDLYIRNKKTCTEYEARIKTIVLAEQGEAADINNACVLAMPVYSITVANILNGIVADTTPSAHSSLLLEIPGINTAKGIARTGGRIDFYQKLLKVFCKDTQERIILLQTVPTTENLPLFTTQIHSIKGASGSIGAVEIPYLAAKLEAAGKAGDLAFVRENIAVFVERLEELIQSIQLALNVHRDTEDPATIASGVDMLLLQDLAAALKTADTADIDRILDDLLLKTKDTKISVILEQISDAVLMAEFDNALEITSGLLDSAGEMDTM